MVTESTMNEPSQINLSEFQANLTGVINQVQNQLASLNQTVQNIGGSFKEKLAKTEADISNYGKALGTICGSNNISKLAGELSQSLQNYGTSFSTYINSIGSVINGASNKAGSFLSDMGQKVTGWVDSIIPNSVQNIGGSFKEKLAKTEADISNYGKALETICGSNNISKLAGEISQSLQNYGTSFSTYINSIGSVINGASNKAGSFLSDMGQKVTGWVDSIIPNSVQNIGDSFKEKLAKTEADISNYGKALETICGSNNISKLAGELSQSLQNYGTSFSTYINSIGSVINGASNKAGSFLSDMGQKFTSSVDSIIPDSVKNFLGWTNSLINNFKNITGELQQKVKSISSNQNSKSKIEVPGKFETRQSLPGTKKGNEVNKLESKASSDGKSNFTQQLQEYQRYLQQTEQLAKKNTQNLLKNFRELAKAQSKEWAGLIDTIGNAFEETTKGLLKGTKSWSTAFRDLRKSITDSLIQTLTQMVKQWVLSQLQMLIFGKQMKMAEVEMNTTAESEKSAIQAVGTATRIAKTTTETGAAIGGSAASASASIGATTSSFSVIWSSIAATAQSILSIPVVGWVIGGLMLAGLASAISSASKSTQKAQASVQNIPSFDVGTWSVPTDMLAMVHQGEIVVPQAFSDKARQLLSGEGAGRPQNINVNYQVNAIDGKSVKSMLKDHGRVIVDVIKEQNRNFAFSK